MKVGFLTFDRDKGGSAGSSRIRALNLIKYDKNFELLKAGVKYDAVVFQKYYWVEYAELYQGVKILDVCDPDWLVGESTLPFRRMVEAVDAIVCNTEATADYLRLLTDKPVMVIKDRHDVSLMKCKKVHKGEAKSAIWFGYSHNASVLKPYIPKLLSHGIKLTIMAEKFVTVCDTVTNEPFKEYERFKQWPETIGQVNKEMLKHNFALLPKRRKIYDQYKSDNKTTHALMVGLPVAEWGDDIDLLISESERIKQVKNRYDDVRTEYDCKKSVQEYNELIATLIKTKNAEKID